MNNPFQGGFRGGMPTLVNDGKALPDMNLKNHIYNAKLDVVIAERRLNKYSLMNRGVPNPNHLIEFRICLISLFHYVSEMAFANKILNYHGVPTLRYRGSFISDFDMFSHVINGESFDVRTLIHLFQYLDFVLHELNLTDLRIDNSVDDSSIDSF